MLRTSLNGAERRSMVMTSKEKELTAYHELDMPWLEFIPETIHYIKLQYSKGRALGVTMNLPKR